MTVQTLDGKDLPGCGAIIHRVDAVIEGKAGD